MALENGRTCDLEWQKSFGGTGSDLLQSIALTNDGGFILAGISNSPKGGDKKDVSFGADDLWIIKLDAKGNELWQRTIGGKGQEQLHSIKKTIDGGYILGATSSSNSLEDESQVQKQFTKNQNSFGNLDYWIVKLDSKGEIEWQSSFGGRFADVVRNIEQTKDGGYIVGGYSNSPESGNKTEKNYGLGDYWVIKLDNKGQQEWQKVYGGEEDDQLHAIHQTYDGNFILGGSSNSGTSGNKNTANSKGMDIWLIKIDETGEILWQKAYNIGKSDYLTSLIENDDHSMLLGCHARSEVYGTKKKDKEDINDYIAIKIDEHGEEIWRKSIGSGGKDVLKKAIEIRDGGYLMAGTSTGKASGDKKSSIGKNDFWIVKLKDKDKRKEDKVAIEAFPNPTAQYTNVIIGYEYEKGTCSVFDLGGRQLQSFDITKERTIPVDLGGLPEGIYVIEVRTNVQKDGVKVIKGIKN
ncbi:T9SS type A sorting domain-containing protein [Flavobacterium azooxidireducens]|uniref:T9SS type A sorting domain-containing protein n=1 Tax=Flavobacterium azooxidireducens TaxID=1871076 RepID=A0ABY4KI17_9FLAO|nr:T9SS type A sorting domain-containing protein [Flavobacterium azooxidireducens]UPQ80457.1 T9SS type A sorting domain-containing protein [Flavobacterium azooxidireducens]